MVLGNIAVFFQDSGPGMLRGLLECKNHQTGETQSKPEPLEISLGTPDTVRNHYRENATQWRSD